MAEEEDAKKKEELEQKKKEAAEAESGDSAGTLDHEVVHSDEVTADVEIVKKTTGSQRRLQVLVVIGTVLVFGGGIFFYTQIEEGSLGIGGGGVAQEKPDEQAEESQIKDYAFVASRGDNSYKQIKIEDNASEETDIGQSIGSDTASDSFQISTNGVIYAVRTPQGIYVNNGEEENGENTFLTSSASQITDWLLIPDGTLLYALVGSGLHEYDTFTGEGGEVAKAFVPNGTDISNLGYAKDGSVRMFAKTGNDLTGSIYNSLTGETETIEKNVTRLNGSGRFTESSISPDGTSLVFTATVRGFNILQQLSTNSLVFRTVYQADDGNAPTMFKWSSDSNNLAVYESGSSPKLVNLRIGTLEKEVLQEGLGTVSSISWSPDKAYVGYVENGTLKAVKLENKEVTELLNDVGSGDINGWFRK